MTAGFDTRLGGTPEASWRRAMDDAPAWEPTTRRLVVVAPHPDDETLGAGGLIAAWRARDREVVVISVSDGEAARPEMPDLAATRRGELTAALAELGVGPSAVRHLGLPDGALAGSEPLIESTVLSLILHDATLVAPRVGDGHPDHDAVGRACARAAHIASVPLARYPIWSWFNDDVSSFEEFTLGRFVLSPEATAQKRRAISRFDSQLSDAHGEPIVPPHVVQYFLRDYEVFLL